MSFEYSLNDKQWYNFICGMQAGMRLQNLELPPYDSNIVLYPIPIGGYGQIGLAIPDILYDGSTQNCVIPVFTHDVDSIYNGFSVRIKFDINRVKFNGLNTGEFGVIGTDIRYEYLNGELLVLGLVDNLLSVLPAVAEGLINKPTDCSEQMILFFINIDIIGTVTKSTPINLEIINTDYMNMNYSTMLKFVQNEIDKKYYLYYITPLKNISGRILSELEDPNNGKLGDDKIIASQKAANGIYVGTTYTEPGNEGVVPIVVCCDVAYDGFELTVIIENETNVVFDYIRVTSLGTWSLTTTSEVDTNGNIVIYITGGRVEKIADSCTVGYIEYKIENVDKDYHIPLTNTLSIIKT